MYDELNDMLVLLCKAISTRKVYFSEHPKVKKLSSEFLTKFKEFCRTAKLQKLFIGIVDNTLVFQGRNLVGPTVVGRQLIQFAERLHCGGFSFSNQTSEREFKSFLDLSASLALKHKTIKEARELLASKDIVNIEIAHRYTTP